MEKKRKLKKKIELEEKGIPLWKIQLLNELQEQLFEEHHDE
jgi:hypothetical protein